VPIVFHALGFDVSYGIRNERTEKFRQFLRRLRERPDVLISLRNDGSLDTLRRVVGEEFAVGIDKVPDGGFFTVPAGESHVELPASGRCVAINLAADRVEYRFQEDAPGSRVHCDAFLARLAGVLNARFRAEDIHAVLVPHIPEDLWILHRLLDKIGPPFCRRRVTVAPVHPR